ncbi:MAG: hypothetical protein ACLR8Y_01755 [Alistipes indistinctus]
MQYGSPEIPILDPFLLRRQREERLPVRTNFNKRNEDGTYPTERNKNGSYRDLHLLQELDWQGRNNNKYGFTGWFLDFAARRTYAQRELPRRGPVQKPAVTKRPYGWSAPGTATTTSWNSPPRRPDTAIRTCCTPAGARTAPKRTGRDDPLR